MARNPWPIKVNECGSNGPFDTAILLLMNKNWKGHLWYVIGLSVGVFAPTIYMAIIH